MEQAFLSEIALADIPLIGPRFQERLARLGMTTVPHVLQYDLATLSSWLGAREARWLHDRVHGIDGSPVESGGEAKSISRDRTFSRDIDRDDDLERTLLGLVTRISADLRGDGLAARTVTVRLRDHDFTTRQASRTVASPFISDRVLLEESRVPCFGKAPGLSPRPGPIARRLPLDAQRRRQRRPTDHVRATGRASRRDRSGPGDRSYGGPGARTVRGPGNSARPTGGEGHPRKRLIR